jgi:hypothetical protein
MSPGPSTVGAATVAAMAPTRRVRTMAAVPRTKPPTPASIRNIHAARNVPALPVRADLRATPRRTAAAVSPLVGLTMPAEAVAATVAVVRRLDNGRLHAPDLVDAAGWVAGQHLAVDATRPDRVRLSATMREGTAIGTNRTHTDSSRRIVITSGVRHLLGLDVDSSVVAYLCAPGTVEIAATATLVAAFAALDRPVVADAARLAIRTQSTA